MPDRVEFGGGHTFAQDGSAWGVGHTPQVGLGMGDSDQVWIVFGYDLGPREVVIIEVPHGWNPVPPPEPREAEEEETSVDAGLEIAREFDGWNLSTQVILGLVVLSVLLGGMWVCRKKLRSWVPGGAAKEE